MTEQTPANENPQPEAQPQKTRVRVLVCKNGQCIAGNLPPDGASPQKIIIPMRFEGDPRLFLKNGELVRPFVKLEADFIETKEVAGVELHIYAEVNAIEFDPSGMEPVAIRPLEKEYEELKAIPQ